MDNVKEIFINDEIAYQYVGNGNYYITKSGVLYSTYVKGAHGKTDINNPHKVAYGQDRDGYYRVVLSDNGNRKYIKIHQIVTMQFIGKCPDGYVVNHKDGNKHNNNVENLEIITDIENIRHAWRTGLNNKELNPNRIHVDVYDNDAEQKYHFTSLANASDAIEGITTAYIRRIKNGIFSFTDFLFKKVVVGSGRFDYKVECYHNGTLFKTFDNNEEAGKYFGKSRNLISSRYKHTQSKIKNRYTITFPNVSTIENTSDMAS